MSTLTIPKVKDLVTLPQEKYNEMFHSLQKQEQQLQRSTTNDKNTVTSNNSMKEDLIHFLKDLGSNTDSGLISNSNFNNFDSYSSNISSFSFNK